MPPSVGMKAEKEKGIRTLAENRAQAIQRPRRLLLGRPILLRLHTDQDRRHPASTVRAHGHFPDPVDVVPTHGVLLDPRGPFGGEAETRQNLCREHQSFGPSHLDPFDLAVHEHHQDVPIMVAERLMPAPPTLRRIRGRAQDACHFVLSPFGKQRYVQYEAGQRHSFLRSN